MIKKLMILAGFCGMLWSQSGIAQALQFHGRTEIEQEISDRLLQNQVFSFGRYFTDMKGSTSSVLLLLLGGYAVEGSGSSFENGDPNGINMLLYDLVMYDLASDIQSSCVSTNAKLNFNDSFLQALNTMCQWPAAQAQTQDAMEAYWLAIMSYDAPEDEFNQWRNFFLSSSYAKKPAGQTLADMTFAILYNPNFLIKR